MKSAVRFLALWGAGLMALIGEEAKEPGLFGDWPEGTSPEELGAKVGEDFLTRKFRYETNPAKRHHGVIYPEICVWAGSLKFVEAAENEELAKKLIESFEPFLNGEKTEFINRVNHVDYRVFGTAPLQIYQMNGDERCLKLGLEFADAQWAETTEDGITKEARYWIDDMYMITGIQVEAYRATKKPVYLDRAALAMAAYLEKLQQPNGLFFHGPDSHFYWGRGNGWVAVGLAELLGELPEDHAKREFIMAAYQKMMAALLECQGEDGLWKQLLDDPPMWPETSGSAMFTKAFADGVKNGWLDAEVYGPATRKAWLSLARHLTGDGKVREVCIGTDKGHSKEFYAERPRETGDLHGQLGFIWAAGALVK